MVMMAAKFAEAAERHTGYIGTAPNRDFAVTMFSDDLSINVPRIHV